MTAINNDDLADLASAAEAIYEWMREPDWQGDDFDLIAWLNRSPLPAAKALKDAFPSHTAQAGSEVKPFCIGMYTLERLAKNGRARLPFFTNLLIAASDFSRLSSQKETT